MKNILLILIGLLFIQGCHVSKMSQFKGMYAQFMDDDEVEIFTEYHTLLSKKPNGAFIFRQFFPETKQITQLITYASDKKTKHGLYKNWYDNGTLIQEGQYKNNKREGQWFQIGTGTGLYQNDKMEGRWEKLYPNGLTQSVYLYKNDQKNGPFTEYDSLGVVVNSGIYQADTILSQSNTDDNQKSKADIKPVWKSCTETDPELLNACSENALVNYIYRNLRYPAIARDNGVQGNVIVQFNVTKEGNIENINFIYGLCQPIKDEVTNLIKRMPSWKPAVKDNKAVDFLFTLPVKFKLE